jgi:hypothetical protein
MHFKNFYHHQCLKYSLATTAGSCNLGKVIEGPYEDMGGTTLTGTIRPLLIPGTGDHFFAQAENVVEFIGEAFRFNGLSDWERQRPAFIETVRWSYLYEMKAFIATRPSRPMSAYTVAQCGEQLDNKVEDIHWPINSSAATLTIDRHVLSLKGFRFAIHQDGRRERSKVAWIKRLRQIPDAASPNGFKFWVDYAVTNAEQGADEDCLKQGLMPIMCTSYAAAGLWTSPHLILATIDPHPPHWVRFTNVCLGHDGTTIVVSCTLRTLKEFRQQFGIYNPLLDESGIIDDE